MKESFQIGFLMLGCFFLYSCQEWTDIEGLRSYLLNPKNNVMATLKHRDFNLMVTYFPSEILTHREISSNNFNGDIDSAMGSMEDVFYLHFTFSKRNQEIFNDLANSHAVYEKLRNEFNFNMPKYVAVVNSDGDTLRCLSSVAPLTFGMSNSNSLLMCFSKELLNGSDWIMINLKDPGFGYGFQRVKFNYNDLKHIPKLKV